MTQDLTHFDAAGQAHMVDVSAKAETHRRAIAQGRISMLPETFAKLSAGQAAKGDVLGIARLAGIMGAKQTGSLSPMCHPIPLTRVTVDFDLDHASSSVTCTTCSETVGRTGVEMEALTAVSIAALTIIDMVKALDPGATIVNVRVEEKDGGRNGHWKRT